jgi:hypothetical protein
MGEKSSGIDGLTGIPDGEEQVQLIQMPSMNHAIVDPPSWQFQREQELPIRQIGIFRLFVLRYVATYGNRYIMRILRPQTTRQTAPVTDEFIFQIDYRTETEQASNPFIEILPGLQHITIISDQNHIPTDYRIDGA